MAPRLVLVPGAWHVPSHYSSLIAALGRHNLVVDCNSNNTTDSTATLEDAAAAVRRVLLSHVEAGRDVVLIAHSYGGGVSGIAGSGLSKSARQQQGKAGGIIGIIWIAAFILQQNQTLLELTRRTRADTSAEMMDPPMPEKLFYNLCSDEDTRVAVAQARPQSTASFDTAVDVVPIWKDCPRSYLLCTKDAAVEPELVHRMLEESKVKWDVKEMDTDHSPFLSRTEDLATWIAGKVQEYASG